MNSLTRDKKRNYIAAVVGSARCDDHTESVARVLGRELVNVGFRLVTGGLGGVMLAASKGAHESVGYRPGDVIGILPGYDASQANEYVDIPICTGLQHARNLVVVATGDVVFAVGGRSGTLSEIALAWTLGKPVLSVGDAPGWASTLAGSSIDDRRTDKIHGPMPPQQAARFALQLLLNHRYHPKDFR